MRVFASENRFYSSLNTLYIIKYNEKTEMASIIVAKDFTDSKPITHNEFIMN